MKLTVCFGEVRVIVPCGDGALLVSELIEQATSRYKKATNKPVDYWIRIHSLKSVSDGGILDADDRVCDVADDKDQIIAEFEEHGNYFTPKTGHGSASSQGTSSPDMFQSGDYTDDMHSRRRMDMSDNDVIITDRDLQSESTLVVRRGSEPTLTALVTSTPKYNNGSVTSLNSHSNSRLPSLPIFTDILHTSQDSDEVDSGQADDEVSSPSPPPVHVSDRDVASHLLQRGFIRDSARRSLANNPSLDRWLDAQEKQQEKLGTESKKDTIQVNGFLSAKPVQRSSPEKVNTALVSQVPKQQLVKKVEEPLVRSNPQIVVDVPVSSSLPESSSLFTSRGSNGASSNLNESFIVCLPKSQQPLGIHVLPYIDDNGLERGLKVHDIEPSGRIAQDGRIKIDDRIVEINDVSLVGASFQRSQEVFRNAMQEAEIRIKIVRQQATVPITVLAVVPSVSTTVDLKIPQSITPSVPSVTLSSFHPTTKSPENSSMDKALSRSQSITSIDKLSSPLPSPVNVPEQSSDKKAPPAIPTRSPGTALSALTNGAKLTSIANTRRIGKKFEVKLIKGADGLGFSVTSRDTPAWGSAPIYIKNILPSGAAIKSGLLKPGDRLLQVNDIEMTGKTQAEAVSLLRNIPQGSEVSLILSRQIDSDEAESSNQNKPIANVSSTSLSVDSSSQLTLSSATSLSAISQGLEQFVFNIPFNNASSGSLGLSVRGRSEKIGDVLHDLGIFIRAIIANGAAAKDGRLQVNDQLLEVNGDILEGKSNSEATELLRNAMQKASAKPGFIQIKIARKASTNLPAFPHEARVSLTEQTLSEPFTNERKINQPAADVKRQTMPSVDIAGPDNAARSAGLRTKSYYLATGNISDNIEDKGKNSNSNAVSRVAKSTQINLNVEDSNQSLVQMKKSSSFSDIISSQHSQFTDSLDRKSRGDSETDASDSKDDPSIASDVETGKFEREAIGRQSMSEKRKGYVDPKSSDLYQKVLEKRTGKLSGSATWDHRRSRSLSERGQSLMKRAASTESLLRFPNTNIAALPPLHESSAENVGGKFGPNLGLKKSSSMESLQTAVEQVATQTPKTHSGVRNQRMVRGRICNDSFRAAVDKSYGYAGVKMDIVEEEANSDASSAVASSVQSRGSSLSNETAEESNQKMGKKDKEKSGGFLKLFKISGKQKPVDDKSGKVPVQMKASTNLKREEKKTDVKQKTDKEILDRENADRTNTGNFIYVSSPQAMPRQQSPTPYQLQQMSSQQASTPPQQANYLSQRPVTPQNIVQRSAPTENRPQLATVSAPLIKVDHRASVMPSVAGNTSRTAVISKSVDGMPTAPITHSERIMQLREEHQRRHRERSGQYPTDVVDDFRESEAYQSATSIGSPALEYNSSLRPQLEYSNHSQPKLDYNNSSRLQQSEYNNSSRQQDYNNPMRQLPEYNVSPRPQPDYNASPRLQPEYNAPSQPQPEYIPPSRPPPRMPMSYDNAGEPNMRSVGVQPYNNISQKASNDGFDDHYQNINEIRAYLQQHDYYQQEYKRRMVAAQQRLPLQRVKPQHPPPPLPPQYDQSAPVSRSTGPVRAYPPTQNSSSLQNNYDARNFDARSSAMSTIPSQSRVQNSEQMQHYIPTGPREPLQRQYGSARNLGQPVYYGSNVSNVNYVNPSQPTGSAQLQQGDLMQPQSRGPVQLQSTSSVPLQGQYVARSRSRDPYLQDQERRYSGLLEDVRWQSPSINDPTYHSLPRRHGRQPPNDRGPVNSAQV